MVMINLVHGLALPRHHFPRWRNPDAIIVPNNAMELLLKKRGYKQQLFLEIPD